MDKEPDATGPVIVHTEHWGLYRERWNDVADLHESGDVARAVFQLKRLAAEGFSPAFAELGDIYECGGGGVDMDLAQAVEWYRKSVEFIDGVRSHTGLARIYLHSKELDPDSSLSFYHLQLLADTDTMAGCFGLGFAYHQGIGTAVDLDAAEECYRRAVEKGHLAAGIHLAQVLLAADKPGGIRMALRFMPRVLWMKAFRPRDPRIGFEYEPPPAA